MTHPVHLVELDLHHNILPPVASTRVDAAPLLSGLRRSGWPGWHVLQPVDQVLHSAAHLFFDSDFVDRVRDVVDLDGLLRHYGTEDGFHDALLTRAKELGLAEPLALAVHFSQAWLGTPLQDDWVRRVRLAGPRPRRAAWLLPLYRAALAPPEAGEPGRLGQRLAGTALLMRYHWNRLPLRLLVPHLWHKWRRGDDQVSNPEPGA